MITCTGSSGEARASSGRCQRSDSTAPWASSSNANVPRRPRALGPRPSRCHSRGSHPLGASQPLCLRPAQLHPFPPRPQGQHVNPWPPGLRTHLTHHPGAGSRTLCPLFTGSCQGKAPPCACHLGLPGCSVARGRAHLLPAHTAGLALYCFPGEVLHTRPNGLFLDLCTCPIIFLKKCGKILIRLTIFKGPAQWYYVRSYRATITSIHLQNCSILQN